MKRHHAEPETDPAQSHRSGSSSTALIGSTFTLAVFLSAALLFAVEPMFGKMVLPFLGGSPAVWTTCMLFFQGALLLGYLYAHVGPRWLGLQRHVWLHIALLALAILLLPVGVIEGGEALRQTHPTLWLLGVLSLSLGIPFVLLSSTGPLLQVWFSRSRHPDAQDPYFLYAASNAGSLLALLSYPFVIEPAITLQEQSGLWSWGYAILLALVAASAAYLRQGSASTNATSLVVAADTVHPRSSPLQATTMVRWTLLAFVP